MSNLSNCHQAPILSVLGMHQCTECQQICVPTQPTQDPNIIMSVSLTIKELETMLKNARAGGSVEVRFTIEKELILR